MREGSFGSLLCVVEVWVRGSCSAASEVELSMETVLIELSRTNDVERCSLETRMLCVSEDGSRG